MQCTERRRERAALLPTPANGGGGGTLLCARYSPSPPPRVPPPRRRLGGSVCLRYFIFLFFYLLVASFLRHACFELSQQINARLHRHRFFFPPKFASNGHAEVIDFRLYGEVDEPLCAARLTIRCLYYLIFSKNQVGCVAVSTLYGSEPR